MDDNLTLFSILLRMRYNFRSAVSVSVNPVINTCLMSGSLAKAASPRISGQVGTLRRCINVSPSFSISSIMILKIAPWSLSFFGRKSRPVPYRPFSGTGIPCNKMNSCGICSRIPAPSPVLLSAPSAPRWRMFSNTFKADSTTSCDFSP